MDDKSSKDILESSSSCEVFEIPDEPAIVINGLPPQPPCEDNVDPIGASNSQSQRPTGIGEWLEGREVRKMFGEKFFNGKVVKFDVENGWYKVVYEDGDSEELDWHELMDVLVPLDVNIPLKTLALKIVKKKQKKSQKSTKGKVRNGNNDSSDGKGNNGEAETTKSLIN